MVVALIWDTCGTKPNYLQYKTNTGYTKPFYLQKKPLKPKPNPLIFCIQNKCKPLKPWGVALIVDTRGTKPYYLQYKTKSGPTKPYSLQ